MKRTVLIIGVVLLAGLLVAATSSAATPTERKLQKQVATLSKQVKTLQTQVKNLRRDTNTIGDVAVGASVFNVCLAAITADVFQGTWAAINAREQTTIFSQTAPPINDAFTPLGANRNACAALQVTRAPASATTNGFDALARIFRFVTRIFD
jgi:outer membrane murein-binding lipoprotein Lpp